MDYFPICEPYTLAMECPDPNNVSDPANYSVDPIPTQCGVTQPEYDIYRKSNDLLVQSVRLITAQERDDIFEGYYWEPHCSGLKPGMNLSVFDTNVNCGSFGCNKIIQETLNIGVDGVWGPITAAAVHDIPDIGAFIEAFTISRQDYYRGLRSFPLYGAGWLNRAANICQDSMSMIGDNKRGTRTLRPFVRSVKAY